MKVCLHDKGTSISDVGQKSAYVVLFSCSLAVVQRDTERESHSDVVWYTCLSVSIHSISIVYLR